MSRFLAFIAMGFFLVGCSNGGSAANPWEAEFKRALEETDSPFVAEVLERGLENGSISAEDYREAFRQMAACLDRQGIWNSAHTDQLGFIAVSTFDLGLGELAFYNQCSAEWVGDVAVLYERQSVNPNNEDFDSLIAACFVRKGLALEGFSGVDYAEWVRSQSAQCQDNVCVFQGMEFDPADPPEGLYPMRRTLPDGSDGDRPEVRMCEAAPLR